MDLQTNFNALIAEYQPVFDALQRALQKFEIDFYLIGAQARDVWISHLGIVKRVTKDIDYCVLVGDRGVWNELNKYLIETEQFVRDTDAPYRFYLGQHIVDIIPFGNIQNGAAVSLEHPLTEVSVMGCKEVAEYAQNVAGDFKVVTLPGLCILKLVANSEKPDRIKDWDDFLLIANNYSDIAGAQLFEGAYTDLLEGDFDMWLACARLLGRHMNGILKTNEALRKTVLSLLQSKLGNFTTKEINEMYAVREHNDKLVTTLKLITEVIRGIQD